MMGALYLFKSSSRQMVVCHAAIYITYVDYAITKKWVLLCYNWSPQNRFPRTSCSNYIKDSPPSLTCSTLAFAPHHEYIDRKNNDIIFKYT